MPTYEYHCEKCNKKFTATLSFEQHDRGQARCPKCQSKRVRQLVSSVSVKTSKKS